MCASHWKLAHRARSRFHGVFKLVAELRVFHLNVAFWFAITLMVVGVPKRFIAPFEQVHLWKQQTGSASAVLTAQAPVCVVIDIEAAKLSVPFWSSMGRELAVKYDTEPVAHLP